MKKIIVTGASGFIGTHLMSQLALEHETFGADIYSKSENVTAIKSAQDMVDFLIVTKPDFVVHAAFLNHKTPEESDEEYLCTVVQNNLPLFHACAELEANVVLISSSSVYGTAAATITEDSPVAPVSLYGVAKALQESLASFVTKGGNMHLVVLRSFNVIGPGQRGPMVLPDWARRLASIVVGEHEPVLDVLTLDTFRDFVDVRDLAGAVARVVSDFKSGELFNVSSGTAVSLRDVCNHMVSELGINVEVREAYGSNSTSNAATQAGSYLRINRRYGWKPTIPWERSVIDVLNDFTSK